VVQVIHNNIASLQAQGFHAGAGIADSNTVPIIILTRNRILQQAVIALQSQENSQPPHILSLLQ
jgi:hypothetical protein